MQTRHPNLKVFAPYKCLTWVNAIRTFTLFAVVLAETSSYICDL